MTLLILFVYFPILNTLNVPAIMAIMGLFLGFTQFQSGIQPVAFAEAFPTQVRYSGSALAYTGANLVINSPWPLVTLCAVINLISLAMIVIGPETRGIDLNAVAKDDEIDTRATAILSK